MNKSIWKTDQLIKIGLCNWPVPDNNIEKFVLLLVASDSRINKDIAH